MIREVEEEAGGDVTKGRSLSKMRHNGQFSARMQGFQKAAAFNIKKPLVTFERTMSWVQRGKPGAVRLGEMYHDGLWEKPACQEVSV